MDSSLWEEPPFVRVLFVTMIALKDADHVCRCDPYKLHNKANLSEQETLDALKILESPDKRRKLIKQEFEGRRIEKVEDGWLILNGMKYRSMIQQIRRREYKNQWQRESRGSDIRSEILRVEQKLAKLKELQKRKKTTIYEARRNGKIEGGTQAIVEGLNEAEGI